MQFRSKNTLTFFALALALVCVLQMAPGARAFCDIGQVKEKFLSLSKGPIMAFSPCKSIVSTLLQTFNSFCPNNDNKETTSISSSSSTTTSATTTTPKPTEAPKP